jgi:hypothetical protein
MFSYGYEVIKGLLFYLLDQVCYIREEYKLEIFNGQRNGPRVEVLR